MKIDPKTLQDLTAELADRPGHVKVASLLHHVLTQGLGARSQDIDFERPLPESVPAQLAKARAIIVFPQPGGPTSNTEPLRGT